MDAAALRESLTAAAMPFGADLVAGDAATPPVHSPLYGELTAAPPDDPYRLAIEFVYEGYLLHYRESRVLAPGATRETRLLAGDHFDARGLRLVAERGDLDSVELLTRLMSACSWLRSAQEPLAYDDDLWVFTVAAMASLRHGGNAIAATGVFDEVDRLIARGRVSRLPTVVRRGADALPLAEARPLRVALGLEPVAVRDGESSAQRADPPPAGGDPPAGTAVTTDGEATA